jgi:galactokinase
VSTPQPEENNDPPVRLLAAFQIAYDNAEPEVILQAPGRDLWLAASTAADSTVHVFAPDLGRHTAFSFRSARASRTLLRRPLPTWARYIAGVVVTLYDDGQDVPGLRLVVLGEELPGPRYHHALGVAVAALWHTLRQETVAADTVLEFVERVRRDYVETA